MIDEGYTVKLDVLRGVRDHFYIAQSNGKATQLLLVKFDLNLKETKKQIYESEEILAVEIDSSLTIDVEHPSHEDSNPEEWEGKLDQLFLLDGEANLLKL